MRCVQDPRFTFPKPCSFHLALGGFTLIELLVTVAIVAILAAVAAPSMSAMIANQRTKSAAADLQMSIMLARSEALKRNASVVISPNTEGWQAGWRVATVDEDRNIHNKNASGGLSIVGPQSMVYSPSGRLRSGSGDIIFDISISSSPTHRCVSIDLNGRPYQRSSETPC
ncbi:pilus assembly FimT family protein [Noviherbaspirillum aerium]|uniref:pilus assembly FimT family protein n=1 Tax=Noviherbaspirillum aerium TaxID=2588497 RepID=UPI00124C591A|nr:GspH/FimT family pseudopilin [Noviherbaspirillum aerium]